MDIIYLHDLKVDCVIGVWEWEKQMTQKITIDLDMGFSIAAAASSDNIDDTLSYKDVSKRVRSFVEASRFELVEKLAEEIARVLTDEFEIKWCRVRINKFGAVNGAGDVGVIIERGQKS